ncbi:MAG: hypothetical protein QM747_05605 [Nocardioides sp.]
MDRVDLHLCVLDLRPHGHQSSLHVMRVPLVRVVGCHRVAGLVISLVISLVVSCIGGMGAAGR